MLKNYLTIAIRNLMRHKLYSALNIAGLAIGMACCILMLLFVQGEFRMDLFHENADRIYRVIQETRAPDKTSSFGSGTPGALGPALKAEFPEVQETVRMRFRFCLVEGNGKILNRYVSLVDKSLFDVFTFHFLKGTAENAFPTPSSVVITENTANLFFGDTDPMGQTIVIRSQQFRGDYTVTGVVKDLSNETSIWFHMLVTDPTRSPVTQVYWEEWTSPFTYWIVQNYVLLPEGYDPKRLEQKLPNLAARNLEPEVAANTIFHLQPLTRMYLYSRADYGLGRDGIGPIYQFSAIALCLLLLACINFTNLATARSVGRAKEVGLRKVVGAQGTQLICQFLGEALLMTGIALILALGLVELLLPIFNDLIGRTLTLTADTFLALLPGLVSVALVTGLLAGSYPAFALSAYQPVETLKGTLKTGGRGRWLRKGLVVSQFAISIFLIIGTFSMRDQIRFMLNQNLGYDPTRIIALPIFAQNQELVETSTERLSNQYEHIKATFLQNPNIQQASAFRSLPTGGHFVRRIRAEGSLEREYNIPINEVDETYFDTFGIHLVAGRTFSPGLDRAFTSEFIINETAAKHFGWTDPIGKQIEWVGVGSGTVVGVMKDYHFVSLHHKISPHILVKRTTLFSWIGLKVREGDLAQLLPFLEETYKQFVPAQPFEYRLLEEDLHQYAYGNERRLIRMAGIASVLAALIASLGLFGLAAFTAQQRTKEIGIRKVLGASASGIVLLLSRDFVKLVLIANLIAWPVAYYAMNRWLENFAYRIDLGWEVFALSGGLALFIALLTVSGQAWQAARANPVDALRNE